MRNLDKVIVRARAITIRQGSGGLTIEIDTIPEDLVGDDHYADRPPSALPQDATKTVFQKWCREGRVAGAETRGRSWWCPKAAWHAARRSGPKTVRKVISPTIVNVEPDEDTLAESYLQSAGFRILPKRTA